MRVRSFSGLVWLLLAVTISGGLLHGLVLPAGAQEEGEALGKEGTLSTPIPLADINQPVTTVADWMAQIEASLVQITEVQVEQTETGLQVVLETENGSLEVSEMRSVGNALLADIPNATIAEEFSQANPIEGIALVSVTSLPGDRVRVAITGTNAPPTAEVRSASPFQGESEEQRLVLAVTLGDADAATEEDAIQVVVTGEQNEGYNPSEASTATRTDTPLRDIPQSIQVIPEQVLEDQQVNNLSEALRNAPGVSQGSNPASRGFFVLPVIRGFDSSDNFLSNGFPDPTFRYLGFEAANIEQLEVLRGPASVLYGRTVPGGTINLVTEQPLSEPYYAAEASVGNFSFYRGEIDLSGPLNEDRTLLYRLNGAAQTTESFVEFFERDQYFIAPTLSWQIGDRTNLSLSLEYINRPGSSGQAGIPAEGSILSNPNGEIPLDLNPTGPGSVDDAQALRTGYTLEHRFSESWEIRNVFRYAELIRIRENNIFTTGLSDGLSTLNREAFDNDSIERFFNFDTYVVGEFATGSIQHQLVTGVNLTRQENFDTGFSQTATPVNLFNPVFDQDFGSPTDFYDIASSLDSIGVYVQDQVSILDNLILLLGLRFDAFEQTNEDFLADTEQDQSGDAFSPRVGIVYQPIEPISFYASYSRSFFPVIGTSFDGEPFEPERSTQYEVGVKADISDRLAATLALFELTRSNVQTDDLDNPGFSIQTGEQRSRGIEFNIAGEILDGWNVIAGYAYTDAEVTEDNSIPEGNRLRNVPEHAFNIWTTYEIQSGDFRGLGFGLGFFFVGDRPGDFANSFELPSYLRTDVAIFYKREQLRLALNFRNLFDIEYFDSANNRLNVFPGDPLTVVGSIAWAF
ncbi:MAG: TonB-dependent siderophore receptor [Elainellaceae cyanobacterium]